MLAERITSPSIDQTELTPFPTHSSELFVVSQNVNSFKIKQIHTLAAKHPGWGAPNEFNRAASIGVRATLIDFYAQCFHGLTNPFPATPFLSHLYKTGECEGDRLQIKMEKRRAGFQSENDKTTGRH